MRFQIQSKPCAHWVATTYMHSTAHFCSSLSAFPDFSQFFLRAHFRPRQLFSSTIMRFHIFSSAVLPGLILVAVAKAVRERLYTRAAKMSSPTQNTPSTRKGSASPREVSRVSGQHTGDRDGEEFKRLTRALYPSEQFRELRRLQERVCKNNTSMYIVYRIITF